MLYPNPLNLAQRSVLPLALLCALSGQSATAATAGMCHYMTNTAIQNVTGHNLQYTNLALSDNFGIHPNFPITWILATGGVTGFTQTWGSSNGTTGGQLTFQIQDGQANPQFILDYSSGVSANPATVADAAATGAQEVTQETLKDAGEDAGEDAAEDAEVPPPADAVLAAVQVLKAVFKIASKIISAFSAEGYLNVNPPSGVTFPTVANLTVDSSQTNTVVVPGSGSTPEEQNLNGYVVSAIGINNGCINSWNVVVAPYCAYVCGYASANNTPVADANCASTTYCSSPASASTNPLFAKTLAAQ
ncbi:MAG: hypothetical protein LM550_02825 [Candidatus Contendobacter sp.]|jgi:hypothetical protein|nr:hypothetical protein [Gammaproteobacteria bacterium]MCC8992626.1 hypothetical protein [Candidatus Contendobacter sp.]